MRTNWDPLPTRQENTRLDNMIRQVSFVVLLAAGIMAMPQVSQPQPRNPPPASPPLSLSTSPVRGGHLGRDYTYVPITRFENDNQGTGNYKWAYETGDQQTHQAEGRFAKAYPGATGAAADETALEVSGSWSYVDADNKRVLVEYTSGVNGYRERRTYQ